MKVRTGYLIKRNRTYYACWTVKGKKFMRTTGHKDLRQARVRMQEILEPFLLQDKITTLKRVAATISDAETTLAQIEDQSHPSVQLDAAWDTYLAAPNRPDSGPSTLSHYEGQFDQFVEWMTETFPAVKTLREVTPDIANAYAAHLTQRGLTANRFNKHVRFLDLLFRVLKDKARLAGNPWSDIQRKRQTAVSRRELTVEELRRVCQSASGELRLLLGIGIYSGLRLGDCATLRWTEVDLVRGVIRRIPNKTARRHPKPVHIPIHPVLRGLLSEAQSHVRRSHFVLPETAALYARDPAGLSKRIQSHFEANGIRTLAETKVGRCNAVVEVGFHSLRHTFVSLCREANAPLAVVEAIVGHANPAMTRYYTHVSEEAAGRAVAALPSLLADAGAATPRPRPTLDQVAEILRGMTAENWRSKRDELLAAL